MRRIKLARGSADSNYRLGVLWRWPRFSQHGTVVSGDRSRATGFSTSTPRVPMVSCTARN